jgi:hypothetical protein
MFGYDTLSGGEQFLWLCAVLVVYFHTVVLPLFTVWSEQIISSTNLSYWFNSVLMQQLQLTLINYTVTIN